MKRTHPEENRKPNSIYEIILALQLTISLIKIKESVGLDISNNSTGMLEISTLLEGLMDWRGWSCKIPALKFDPSWKVQIIPPFCGAVIRFRVEKDGCDSYVSIYLDCYDILGRVGSPYWEIYPYEGDTYRVPMYDTEALIEGIRHALDHPEEVKEKDQAKEKMDSLDL